MAKVRISKVPNDPLPFIADYVHPDTKVRTETPCATPEEADTYVAMDCSWIARGGRGMTVAQMLFHLLRRYEHNVYMVGTLSDMRNCRDHVVPVIGKMVADDVRAKHILALIKVLRKSVDFDYAKHVVRKLLVGYRDAIAAGWMHREPITEALALFKGQTRHQRKAEDIDEALLDRLLATADAEERLIVLLMADAGLVSIEIAALQRMSFRLGSNPTVTVRLVVDAGRLREHTKTSVARTVRLTPRAAAAMLDYERELGIFLLPEDLLFQRKDGGPCHDSTILYRLSCACRKAGVKLTGQQLRFHAAAKWIASGISIVGLADRLGLKDPLRVAKTFELLLKRQKRTREMGLVSQFLFGVDGGAIHSSSPQSSASSPLPKLAVAARAPYRHYRYGRPTTYPSSPTAAG